MSEMISFGAGMNSVAMTIMLVNEGWHGPIVFADTGGEHPETYCYMTMFERDWLKPRGLEITRISPETYPEPYEAVVRNGQKSLEAYCLAWGIIPLMAVRWCSHRFKRLPMETWRKAQGIDITLMGICADEPRRLRDDLTVAYPLADRGITRAGCTRIIQAVGLMLPRKSSCFFCPAHTYAEWRDLYHHYPELYQRAAQLEYTASERFGKRATLNSHDISLDEMRERRWQGQTEMDLSEWLPCACVL